MIVTLDLVKAQLNLTPDDGDGYDALLTHKISAAEVWLENYIGKPLADFDPLPADLVEAVLQLVAFWFENREAAVIGPHGRVQFDC